MALRVRGALKCPGMQPVLAVLTGWAFRSAAGACVRIGWLTGSSASWTTCPNGYGFPAVGDTASVAPCVIAGDSFGSDNDIAAGVGGCNCKWNGNWCARLTRPAGRTLTERNVISRGAGVGVGGPNSNRCCRCTLAGAVNQALCSWVGIAGTRVLSHAATTSSCSSASPVARAAPPVTTAAFYFNASLRSANARRRRIPGSRAVRRV